MAINQNDGFRSNVNIYENEQKIKKYVKILKYKNPREKFQSHDSKDSKQRCHPIPLNVILKPYPH